MALPPWTVELLKRGVADLARQVTDNETAASLKEQASKFVDELPKAAREKVDSILRQAEATARPIKDVWQSGVLWGGGKLSLTPTRLINASGRLLDPRGSGVGLPADALDAALPFLSGDGSQVEHANERFCHEIADTISRRGNEHCDHRTGEAKPTGESKHDAGPLAAIVTHSLDASLALIATLGNRGGCIHVPRCCAVPLTPLTEIGGDTGLGEQPDDLLIDRLRRHAKGAVREFGRLDGSDQWNPAHFSPQQKTDPHRDHGKQDRPRQHTLVRLANVGKPREQKIAAMAGTSSWTEVVVIPIGTLFSAAEAIAADSLTEQLRGGADIVVLGGGVLAGTPGLSLIVGREDAIERLRRTPRYGITAALPALTAIVATSVKLQAAGTSPVAQLAGVSEQNLHDRATRLATQLGGCEGVRAARVTEHPATLGVANPPIANRTRPDSLASRQVVLSIDESRDVATIARRLAEAPIGLLCRTEDKETEDKELVIDLRWVSPDQQSLIGELVEKAM